METKIKAFVVKHLPTMRPSDRDEIVANLIDRYHDLLNQGKPSDIAYGETMSQLGDFSTPHESLKPGLFTLFLFYSSLFLMVISLISLWVSFAIASLFTLISWLIYLGISHYWFQQYTWNKKDVPLKSSNLSRSFTFLWVISLSGTMVLLLSGTSYFFAQLSNFTILGINSYVTIEPVGFFIVCGVFLIAFSFILVCLVLRPYYLTWYQHTLIKVPLVPAFIYQSTKKRQPSLAQLPSFSYWILIGFTILHLMMSLSTLINVYGNSQEGVHFLIANSVWYYLFNGSYQLEFLPLRILSISFIGLVILGVIKWKPKKLIILGFNLLWLLALLWASIGLAFRSGMMFDTAPVLGVSLLWNLLILILSFAMDLGVKYLHE